jgi:hypothetical protein
LKRQIGWQNTTKDSVWPEWYFVFGLFRGDRNVIRIGILGNAVSSAVKMEYFINEW